MVSKRPHDEIELLEDADLVNDVQLCSEGPVEGGTKENSREATEAPTTSESQRESKKGAQEAESTSMTP